MSADGPVTGGRVVVVRHGETEWSRENRHTGRTDLPLTARGREQAEGLVAQLGALHFGTVLVSPLRRARETCDLAGFAADATVDPDLVEWDYGDYEGMTTAEIRAIRPGWSLFRDGVAGGEMLAGVAARADRVIARLRAVQGDALIFAHGHLLCVLTARWLELPPEVARRLFLEPASPSMLGHIREWTALLSWNGLG